MEGFWNNFFYTTFHLHFLAKNGIFGYRFHFEGKNDVLIIQVRRVKKVSVHQNKMNTAIWQDLKEKRSTKVHLKKGSNEITYWLSFSENNDKIIGKKCKVQCLGRCRHKRTRHHSKLGFLFSWLRIHYKLPRGHSFQLLDSVDIINIGCVLPCAFYACKLSDRTGGKVIDYHFSP